MHYFQYSADSYWLLVYLPQLLPFHLQKKRQLSPWVQIRRNISRNDKLFTALLFTFLYQYMFIPEKVKVDFAVNYNQYSSVDQVLNDHSLRKNVNLWAPHKLSFFSESEVKMWDKVASLLAIFNSFKKTGKSVTLILSTKGGEVKAKLEVKVINAKSSPSSIKAPSSTLLTPPGCQTSRDRQRPHQSAARRSKAPRAVVIYCCYSIPAREWCGLWLHLAWMLSQLVFFVLYSYVYIYTIICANVRNIWEIFWASDQEVNYLFLCRFLLLPLHRLRAGSTNIWPCTALNCLVLSFNSHHHLSNKINQEFVHCLSTWDGNMRSISIWPLQIVHTLHPYINIENRESTPSRFVIIICTSSESFLKNGIWSQALLCLQFKHCRQKRLCKAYARPRQRPWQV